MWIYNNQTSTWINLEYATRIFKDGINGWAVKQTDGQVTYISDEEYEKVGECLKSPRNGHGQRPDSKEREQNSDFKERLIRFMLEGKEE